MTDREILVIGEALIDVVKTADSVSRFPGGSPTNVAVGLARLWHSVTELTALGNDEDGAALRAHLQQASVQVHPASVIVPSTSVADVTLSPEGDATYEFSVSWRVPTQIEWEPYDLVHAGSIALALQPGATDLLPLLQERPDRVLLSVDPNVRAQFMPFEHARELTEPFLREADIVKLSHEDAEYIYPGIDDPDFVLEHILGLGPKLAVITLGPHGAILANSTARVWVPATSRRVVDTIGAGDSFMAGLIDALLSTENELSALPADALRRIGAHASEAAAITVGRPGADLPWRTELPLHTTGPNQGTGGCPSELQ